MRSLAVLLLPALAAIAALASACGPSVLVAAEPSGGTAGAGAAGSGAAGPTAGGGADDTGGTGASSSTGTGGAGSTGTGTSGTSGGGAGGPGKPHWAKGFGGSGHQHLHGLASDAQGNALAVGDYDGDLDFGTGKLKASGPHACFVAKLDPKGHALWALRMTADSCVASAVAVDEDGDVLVTGFVKGSLHVADAPAAGGDGIFVVKLDTGGTLVWARTFGTSAAMQADRGLSIAATPDLTSLFVSGSFAGALDLGSGPLPAMGGVFVLSLDPDGGPLWSTALPGSSGVVAASGAGHAIVATTDATAMSMAVQDLDGATGSPLWSHTYGPGSFDAVTVDSHDNVLLAGSTTTADFGGGTLPNPLPSGEGFLVSLDGAGQHRYTHGLPFDSYQSSAVALTVGQGDGVAVTGSYVHHVDASTVMQSAFLVTFDASGDKVKSQTFGPIDGQAGIETQEGWGVAPAPAGGFYLGGDYYTEIDIAGAKLTGDGSSDVFVARIAP